MATNDNLIDIPTIMQERLINEYLWKIANKVDQFYYQVQSLYAFDAYGTHSFFYPYFPIFSEA